MKRVDVMRPATRYARSGDLNIAYQVVGDGALDLVVNWGWVSNIELIWDDPEISDLVTRLAAFSRVITFDKRGTGMSDRVPETELPTLEQRMDDVRAVVDAAGSKRAAMLGISEGGPLCMMFAATYPDRTASLVVYGSWATWIRHDDYPWAPTLEQHEKSMEIMRYHDPSQPLNLERFAPSRLGDNDFANRFARYGRLAASPGAAMALNRMNIQLDIRHILPTIRVPTLVIHRTGDRMIYPQAGRYLADHIPGAKYVELPGTDHIAWSGDREALVGEIEEFLTGVRHIPDPDRVLATVLFTDIVDSTKRASAIGDHNWKELLNRHDAAIMRQIERFRGRKISMAGDSFLVTFDGPARAVRCAQAIIAEVRPLGLEVRVGLHTGEIELVGDDIQGLAVHIAARVSAKAGPGEILSTSTVRDLTAGSGIHFEDRGNHELKGIPEPQRIYAVRNI